MAKVLYEKRDRIAYVTINRPEARNAVDPETHELLWATWEDFRDDAAVDVAILTGAGDEAFCAGADLKTYIPPWIESATPRQVRDNVARGFGGLTRGLHRIYKPTIAAVNGWALAGGLVSRLVPHERLMEEAERTARTILRNSQVAVRSAKETILDVIGRPLDDQLRIEALNAYACADPEETMARLRQFYDRTDPGRAGRER